MTLAESLFEAACAAAGIRAHRIAPSAVPGRRRPDYRVDLAECGAFVEVKQINPNEADRRFADEKDAGGIPVLSIEPGARLRGAIRDANGQLRQASMSGVPTLVAILDATSSLVYTDPYAVKTAMFGLDAMVIAVPRDRSVSPHFLRMKRRGKATLTEEDNRSISAVAVIRPIPPREGPAPLLLVYLNHWARVPLNESHLRGHVAYQFALGQDKRGATDWIEL